MTKAPLGLGETEGGERFFFCFSSVGFFYGKESQAVLAVVKPT